MKKIVLLLSAVCTHIHPIDDSKQPPAYELDDSVKKITQQFFLKPLESDNTELMTLRAEAYFKGTDTIAAEPLMGFALLQIAADAQNAQACVNLATQLLENPLIHRSQQVNNKAQLLLCKAVRLNHPSALSLLRKLNHQKILQDQAVNMVPEEDISANVLLRYVQNKIVHYQDTDIHSAGTCFLQGNINGLKPDPLRALALYCYLHQKFPHSPLGPLALAQFMSSYGEQQVLFNNNKQIAHFYEDNANSRGLPDEISQQLNESIRISVEPQERTILESFWDFMSEIFG